MTQPLTGIHHSAYRCRDAEETRAFYEDVLGFPLATVVTGETEPGSRVPHAYAHLFFRMPDGNFIAFFDAPSSAPPSFDLAHAFDRHIAFEVEGEPALKAWQDKLLAAQVPCFGPVDHDFCKSIYFPDPNGLQLEITARVPSHDAILAAHEADAPGVLAAWIARKSRIRRAA